MSAEAEIRTYAERIVSLEIERRERAADIKDIKAEAKGRGLSPKLITACVRMLLLEADKRAAALSDHEELDLYLNACGLISGRGVEDEEPPHPGFCPVAQDEGQADHAGKASDERSAGTAGSQVTEQSEEFVTTAGAGEAARAANASAPASDGQASPEGASESGSEPHCRQPQPKQLTGGDSRRDGNPSPSGWPRAGLQNQAQGVRLPPAVPDHGWRSGAAGGAA